MHRYQMEQLQAKGVVETRSDNLSKISLYYKLLIYLRFVSDEDKIVFSSTLSTPFVSIGFSTSCDHLIKTCVTVAQEMVGHYSSQHLEAEEGVRVSAETSSNMR